jgi:hypothetical protein
MKATAHRRVNPLRGLARTSGFALARGLARKVSAVIAECHYAQHRMIELATAPDRSVFRPDAPPDTYAEFLYRTSGVLRHEPSARARARSRALR